MARLGAKVSRNEVLSIQKKTFLDGIFWWNRSHTSFLGLIGYMVRSGAKLFQTKTFLNSASKALSNSFFQKTRFWFQFLYEITPHLFSWPNGLDGTIGGKCVPERSFAHPKKHVFGWNFLMKPAAFLFFGPNWLYGAFGGKIIPVKNFAQFCLKCPIEFVFPNNTFLVWIFWPNWPHTSFPGLIGYMVRSAANLFRTKTLLNSASKALLNSFFHKTGFRFEFLY